MTDIKLNIEKINGKNEWYFLDYIDPDKKHFKMRMVIEKREDDDWIGLQIKFPWTHENAMDSLIEEIKLAKEAIKQIKSL